MHKPIPILLIATCSIGLMLFSMASLCAQNLAPNPSFETYIACPENYGFGDPLDCVPWVQGNGASSDFFHPCCIGGSLCVPVNFFGSEPAHTGAAYTGMYLHSIFPDYREYIQAPLLEPLEAGMGYYVSFQVSLAENYCGVRPYGAYFSAQPPPFDGTKNIDVQPQVFTNGAYLDDMDGWTEISGCFIAQGGEAFITIGNFLADTLTELDPGCPIDLEHSYYYLDDVVVEQMDVGTLPLELGDPVVVCYEYVISPGLDGHYQWSDGTTNPYLLVTQSGTYAVTISELCSLGIDSIEVTILGAAEVELPDDTVICAGEVITISLDPDAGEYTWQDGSNDPEYTITTTGTYTVSLDDQCDITTAEINVEVVEFPEPFTLGPDIQLCEGEVLEFDFDPDLGQFHWQDNSDANTYTITGPGEYALTISNTCGAEMDALVVTYFSPPALEFPFEQTELCIGDVLLLSVDPDMGEYIWQDGSTDPYYLITTGGEYFATVTNLCGVSSDSVSIDLILPPVIELGPDQVLCSAQLPFTLDAGNDPFAWDYNWQDGSGESVYEVTATGLYTVTVSNICFEVIDMVELIVVDSVLVVQLPDDQAICPGDSLVLSVDDVDGNYTWQDMSTMATYTVTNPGVYHVTVANDCGAGSDSISVSLAAVIALPSLGPDISLCPGESVVLHLNDPIATFLWQDGSTNDSLLINSAGQYYVTAFNNCGALSDTVLVSITAQPPVVDLPDDLILCQGQSISLDAGVPGVNYLWNDNSTGSSININTAGTYSITVSNNCGTDTDSITIVDGGPAPLVDLGNDISLCPGEVLTITPSASAVVNWLWSNGSTSDSISISAAGITSVIVSNSCGTSYDTINAILLPAVPVFDLGNDTSLCAGEMVNLSISLADVSIAWSDGSTDPALAVSTPGQYFATISNACGNFADTIDIAPLPPIPPLDLGNDQSLCPGELIVINPGILNVDYLWQDGSTDSTFSTTQAITISLTISNACGSATDQMIITESTEGPQVNLGNDIVGCEGDEVTIQSGISGVDYLWQDGSTQTSFTTSVSGEFILNVDNNCGTDADTILVDLSGVAPTVSLGADTVLCDDDLLVLTVTTPPGATIAWQDGSSTTSFEVQTAGSYAVVAANDCGEATDTIAVAYAFSPQAFSLGPDTVLCAGESIVLTAPVTPDVIQWQDGSASTTFIADQNQLYALQISNQCGVASDEMQLTLIDESVEINLDPLIHWCPQRTLTINVEQPFPATYLWNTGATTPSISITSPGTYSISIQTNCAIASDSFDVILDEGCFSKTIYFIPNIFSPNGDGINDIFTVQFNAEAELLSMEGTIYDRWGNVLFASSDNPFTWNGKRKDEEMNPAVFVYVFRFTFLRNGVVTEEKVTGDVSLIR